MSRSESTELEHLRRHLDEVERELARYAATYGMTDQARHLFRASPLPLKTNGAVVPFQARSRQIAAS